MIAQTVRAVGRAVLPIGAVIVLAACAGPSPVGPAPATSAPAAGHSVAERAAAIALSQVGVPYRYGGSSPGGFDCSGLVHYSYLRAGKAVPRTTAQLWNATTVVGSDELQTGDLLFFRFDGKLSHVGLYVGDRRFVHAPSSGKRVVVESLSTGIYRDALMRAGRPR